MDPDIPARWVVTSGEAAPAAVERLLLSLPGWFGIDVSNAAYVESARKLPTYLARPAANPGAEGPAPEPVGVLLARRHFQNSAEIHLMAVAPDRHRQGVGRALVAAVEADLISDGCQLLQVKTLGPSHPDAGYALTRQFYTSLGFLPLEERTDLWGPQNPCLMMVKVLASLTVG
ncbi:MAG TPA: GNAT family N-acetyltransferase [Streptosporangiaceae bacterium]